MKRFHIDLGRNGWNGYNDVQGWIIFLPYAGKPTVESYVGKTAWSRRVEPDYDCLFEPLHRGTVNIHK